MQYGGLQTGSSHILACIYDKNLIVTATSMILSQLSDLKSEIKDDVFQNMNNYISQLVDKIGTKLKRLYL